MTWKSTVEITVATPDATAAELAGDRLLREMDVAVVTTRIQPITEDESYVISAELDLSPIGLPDQTSAETVIKYVIRNFETTWQVVQRPPSSAKYVWPSMAPQNDASRRFPEHPNISAIVVEASAGDRGTSTTMTS